MNDLKFFLIDLAILLVVVRIDLHLRRIERNTRRPDNKDLWKITPE